MAERAPKTKEFETIELGKVNSYKICDTRMTDLTTTMEVQLFTIQKMSKKNFMQIFCFNKEQAIKIRDFMSIWITEQEEKEPF